MIKKTILPLFLVVMIFMAEINAVQAFRSFEGIKADVAQDFRNVVRSDNLLWLGGALAVAGVSANTGLDRTIDRRWQTRIKRPGTQDFFYIPEKIFGNGAYPLAISLGLVSLGYTRFSESKCAAPLFNWGYKNLRAYLIGSPQQIALTYALGSGRPLQGAPSRWQPFRHNTGVSGHAFNGAVPFITAAMMVDAPLLKYSLYALSTLSGLSRIQSRMHYPSQVLMGWTIAYLSCNTVFKTDSDNERKNERVQLGVVPKDGKIWVTARVQF